MYERVEDELEFSDDFSPIEEESMPEAAFHDQLLLYLVEVLNWLFHGYRCAIHRNLAFYSIQQGTLLAVAPDIAVVKGLPFQPVKSWRIGQTGPQPHVVFEILSAETWRKDVEEKPELYGRLGVQEYFAYDPNPDPLSQETAERLFGWRLDSHSHHMTALLPNEDASLWSQQLGSWLVPAGSMLHLQDPTHHLRLTEAEAYAQQAELATRARWAEARARRVAERRAAAEAAARQVAEREARALAEKLRALGFDPDQG